MLGWLGVGFMTNPLLVVANMKLQIWMKKKIGLSLHPKHKIK
jgi:hypothetical protein